MKANLENYEFLVNNNIGLVYKIVSRFYVTPFERDDLIQAGLMGLLKAARKFNVHKGFQFSTYAIPFILGEIKKEFNKRNLISVNSYFKKIAFKVQNASCHDSLKKIASSCKTSIENVILATNYQQPVLLLDPVDMENISYSPSLTEQFYTHSSSFNDIDKEIFRLRFFYQYTQKEIAKKLNLNQSSISRRLHQIASSLLENK